MNNTIESPAIQTAREILHDTAYFKASKEYARYWVPYFEKDRDAALNAIMNGHPTHEEFLAHKAIYLARCHDLDRIRVDEEVALKMLDQSAKKFPK